MLEVNSMAVMIDWLITSSNYNQWHGGDKQNGATKLGITNQKCQIIEDKGITTEKGKDIHIKINHMEHQFRDAKDLLNQTGAGVTFEESIMTGAGVTCKESIMAAVKMEKLKA